MCQLEVVGQHAQEDVGADAVGQAVADRAHVEVGVEGAEEPLDVCESLVARTTSSRSGVCRRRLVRST